MATRTFRIFVSSTFSDLKAERNALQDHVFPKLRDLCRENEFRFQPIDLRWGVSEEAGWDQRTMEICLHEIRRCQMISPRPNFIVLLGDRYGWCPLPYTIDAREFEMICKATSEPNTQKLTDWYHMDLNSEPPVYYLKARTGKFRNYEEWQAMEQELRSIFLAALDHITITPYEQQKYIASATEQEILQGALHAPDTQDHVFCFFRSIRNLPEDSSASKFRDLLPSEEPNTAAHQQLRNLKERLKSTLGSNVTEYEAEWSGSGTTTDHIEKFCHDVYRLLSGIIQREISNFKKSKPLDQEISEHANFRVERTRVFIGRTDILNRISRYLSRPAQQPLVVWGHSGCGKSTVIARAIEQIKQQNTKIVYRFTGATPISSNSRSLLESICQEISIRYGADESPLPTDLQELAKEFPKLLSLATTEQPLVLFIDALDQLFEQDGSPLSWIPLLLPPNVWLVLSTVTGELLDSLRQRLDAENILEIDPLNREEASLLLDTLLHNAGRRLQPAQHEFAISRIFKSGLPLYSKLVFEEVRNWRSYEGLNRLEPDTSGMVRQLFERLSEESNHGEIFVSRSLSYLAASKNGLTEDELLAILSSDQELFQHFLRHAHRDHDLPKTSQPRLPVVLWSRLYFDLRPYLTERAADGTSVFSFYHPQFKKIISDICLQNKKPDRHKHLVSYFGKKRFRSDNAEIELPNLRRYSELPFQQASAKLWSELKLTLTDLSFLEGKCTYYNSTKLSSGQTRYLGIYDVMDDFHHMQIVADETYNLLPLLQSALQAEAHQIRETPELLPQQLHNVLIQQPDRCKEISEFVERIVAYQRTMNRSWFRMVPDQQDSEKANAKRVVLSIEGDFPFIALSPDEKQVCGWGMGTEKAELAIWSMETGKQICWLTRKPVLDFLMVGLYWFPDGERLFAATMGGEIAIWDATAQREVKKWKYKTALTKAVLSADGQTAIVVDEKGSTVVMCDPLSGEEWMSVTLGQYEILYAVLNANGRFAVLGGRRSQRSGGLLLKLDLLQGTVREITSFPGGGTITALSLSHDENVVALGDAEGTVTVVNLQTAMVATCFPGRTLADRTAWQGPSSIAHSAWVQCVAFSKDDSLLFSGSGQPRGANVPGEVCIWNLNQNALVGRIPFSAGIESIALLSGQSQFVAGGQEGLSIENVSASADGAEDVGEGSYLRAVAFSADGKSKAMGRKGEIIVVHSDPKKRPVRMQAHHGHVACLAWDPLGDGLASGGDDGRFCLWHAGTGEFIGEIPSPWPSSTIQSVHFLADGSVAFSTEFGCVLMNRSGETAHLQMRENLLTTLAFSADGRRMAIGRTDGAILVSHTSSPSEVQPLRGHQAAITDIRFFNNTGLLSAAKDGTIRKWDLTTGQEVAKYEGHQSLLSIRLFVHRALAPLFLSCSDDFSCRCWNEDPGASRALLPMKIWPLGMAIQKDEKILAVIDYAGNERRFLLNELFEKSRR